MYYVLNKIHSAQFFRDLYLQEEARSRLVSVGGTLYEI